MAKFHRSAPDRPQGHRRDPMWSNGVDNALDRGHPTERPDETNPDDPVHGRAAPHVTAPVPDAVSRANQEANKRTMGGVEAGEFYFHVDVTKRLTEMERVARDTWARGKTPTFGEYKLG